MTDKQLQKMGYRDLLECILKTRSKKTCQALVKRWIELTYEKLKDKAKHTLVEWAGLQQANLGYMAGYYDTPTAARILERARLKHSFFGGPQAMRNMTGEKALKLGMKAGAKHKKGVQV